MEKKADLGVASTTIRGLYLIVSKVFPFESEWRKEVEVACKCNARVICWTITTFPLELLQGLCYDTNTLKAELT